jgi:hypothetical protein
VHELAVLLALHIDDTPTVFAATDRLAVDNHIAFGANDGERDHVLRVNISGLFAFQ